MYIGFLCLCVWWSGRRVLTSLLCHWLTCLVEFHQLAQSCQSVFLGVWVNPCH